MLEPAPLKGLSAAIAVTALLAAFLAAIEAAYRRLTRTLEARRRAGAGGVAVQRLELASADRVTTLLRVAARWLRNALVLIALYLYVPLLLSVFPWTEPLAEPLLGYFLQPLAALWEAFVGYLPSAVHVLVVVLVARYSLKLLHVLFQAIAAGRVVISGFHDEWAEPTYKLLRIVVVVIVLVDALPHLPGASSQFFQGVSLLVGAMVTFGSSSAVSNLVSGTVLIYTRGFRVGDHVEIGDASGEVVERTLLKTQLRTRHNEIVTIPNGRVLNANIVNFSAEARERGLFVTALVSVGYHVDWRTVHELLERAATRTEHVLAQPKPFVVQSSLEDSRVGYEINAATDRADLVPGIRSQLQQNILDSFNEAGIEIVSPRYSAVRDGNTTTVVQSPEPGESPATGSEQS